MGALRPNNGNANKYVTGKLTSCPFKRFHKLFSYLSTPGRGGIPLMWGNRPVHISSPFKLIMFA